jgi:hypothetical protein
MHITKKSAFEYYKLAIEARNLELRLFWQRSLFFAGFIAAIFIAYYTLHDRPSAATDSGHDFFELLLLILGTFFSLAWSLGNRGSKYWYESWETKIDKCEEILQVGFFHDWSQRQPKFWLYRARLYSVSKIATYLSDLVVLAWLVLLGQHFDLTSIIQFGEYKVTITLAGLVIIILLVLLFWGTRTNVPDEVLDRWKQEK